MFEPLLATKLYIPPTRLKVIYRTRLLARLYEGLHGKLTVVSAPAGSGKTTLLSEWAERCNRPIAWLSLDEADNNPTRFLTYFITALQTVSSTPGNHALTLLQSPQLPSIKTMLTMILNDLSHVDDKFVFILDDYHVVDAQISETILTFLVDHMPTSMHLILSTRENPALPLSRWRARGQLNEINVDDLRFTISEAAGFFNQVMELDLKETDISTLHTRTEGWIAGLQLAGIALRTSAPFREDQDNSDFIRSFTGSHYFILDYLWEEVLQHQPEEIRHFLLSTCILDRLCAPLCNAILGDSGASSQEILEYLERTNLFIVPLDNQRRWYRYHHLFADLLRQRLSEAGTVNELHRRASIWYEANGFMLEAFRHSAAGQDVERAEHLLEGNGMPLLFQGAMLPVVQWLDSLPPSTLNAQPLLWVWYAFASMALGESQGIEQKLQAAEVAMSNAKLNYNARDMIGRIATIRSMLAIQENDVEAIIAQSNRALEFLNPENLSMRTATMWALGYAYHLRGDRTLAREAYGEAITMSETTGNVMFNIAATSSLASLQQADYELHRAVGTYERVLTLAGEPPLPHANGAYLGLAQIFYEWNDLNKAYEYGEQALHLALQIESIAVPVPARVLLARVKFAQGEFTKALTELDEAERFIKQYPFAVQQPELVTTRVRILLHHGDFVTAKHIAQIKGLPTDQARVFLALGNPASALEVLESVAIQVEPKDESNEQLSIMVLQALAYYQLQNKVDALRILRDVLMIAEKGGFIRTFVDEGPIMSRLLGEVEMRGTARNYIQNVLKAFVPSTIERSNSHPEILDQLSARELEVLEHMAEGLSNPEIAGLLHVSLNTIKVHSRNIYSKLAVHNRVQAVSAAKSMGLLL